MQLKAEELTKVLKFEPVERVGEKIIFTFPKVFQLSDISQLTLEKFEAIPKILDNDVETEDKWKEKLANQIF